MNSEFAADSDGDKREADSGKVLLRKEIIPKLKQELNENPRYKCFQSNTS